MILLKSTVSDDFALTKSSLEETTGWSQSPILDGRLETQSNVIKRTRWRHSPNMKETNNTPSPKIET